jgi:hypothetical protein
MPKTIKPICTYTNQPKARQIKPYARRRAIRREAAGPFRTTQGGSLDPRFSYECEIFGFSRFPELRLTFPPKPTSAIHVPRSPSTGI